MKEKQTLDFIKNYLFEQELAPTLAEIAAGIGFTSKGSTSRYVNQLIQKGYLSKQKSAHQSRNLALTDKPNAHTGCVLRHKIPIIGTIAAGAPIEAITQNDQQDINEVIQGDNAFALRVKGLSMIEEGINDGDLVICQYKNTADDGDIVVALIDNQEATLKRFYRKKNIVLLCPANCDMAPMEYEASRVSIQGVLKNLIRSF